jgi:hypothetical protein
MPPAAAPPAAADLRLTLDTAVLGPLVVPAGADRAAALEDLAARAAIYATRARGDGTRCQFPVLRRLCGRSRRLSR